MLIGCFQGGCRITPEGYAQMTHMLKGLANGKVIMALEVRNCYRSAYFAGYKTFQHARYLNS